MEEFRNHITLLEAASQTATPHATGSDSELHRLKNELAEREGIILELSLENARMRASLKKYEEKGGRLQLLNLKSSLI